MSATQTQPANGAAQRPAPVGTRQARLDWLERTYNLKALEQSEDAILDVIAQKERACLEASDRKAAAERALSELRQEVFVEVNLETDDKGKPKYSNADLRNGETDKRLRKHPDAAPHLKAAAQAEHDLSLLRLDIDDQFRRLKAVRSKLKMRTAMFFAVADH